MKINAPQQTLVLTDPQHTTGCSAACHRLIPYSLVAILGLISILPIWIPSFPAMCDAPQHASQVVIFSQLDHPGFAYSQLFYRHTRIPNLAGYLLLLLLKPLVGVVAACNLAVSVALLVFLLSTSQLIAEFNGEPLLALLTIPALLGYSFQWGFIGYLAAAPLGIYFLILAMRYFRRPSLRRGVGLILFFLFVFFCHALIAAYAAALAAVYALANLNSARQLFVRWLPLLATVPASGVWWVLSVAQNPHTHKPMEWDLDWDRIPNLFQNITGWPDPLLAFLIVLVLVTPLVVLLGLRRQPRYYYLLAFCIVTAFLCPHGIFGVTSLYERFVLFVLPCFALTLTPFALVTRRRANLAVAWLVLVALAWTASATWRMCVFEREAKGFSTLLRQMSPGQRVLSINFEPSSSAFDGMVFLHYPVWYSAVKSGVVDPSFACGNVDLILYRREAMPKVRFDDFEFHPSLFNWQEHEGWRYRYFVLHSPVEMGAKLFNSAGNPVVLRVHEGDWWLYESMPVLRPSSASQLPAS